MTTHDERIDGIRNYLGMWKELRDRTGAKGADGIITMADYLIDNADAFTGRVLPDAYEMGEMKQCFANAGTLALEDDSLTYYEGYAVGNAGIPVHHAWCVDEDGMVVDPTWRLSYADGDDPSDPAEWAYFGVGFDTAFLSRVIVEKETWGVLDSPLVYEDEAA